MATSAPGPDELADIDEVDVHAIPAPDLLKMLASLLTQIAQQNDSLLLPLKDPDVPASPLTPHPAPPEALSLTTAARHALESSQSLLTFHARNIPTITLEAYLLRILKYCPTTNEVFLSLLVYFERMGKLSREMWSPTEGLVIDSYNVHRLVIAGVTVASKFFSDVFYTNSRYAKVGGLPQAELNQLELQFLLLNNFQLSIPHDEMQRY
ncbi:cyclin PHO80-like protein, partial [Flagelloscypha sp. PMI_526]